jgi:hypothetical protein
VLEELAGLIPDEWLGSEADSRRAAYADYLSARLEAPRGFAAEAERARG